MNTSAFELFLPQDPKKIFKFVDTKNGADYWVNLIESSYVPPVVVARITDNLAQAQDIPSPVKKKFAGI